MRYDMMPLYATTRYAITRLALQHDTRYADTQRRATALPLDADYFRLRYYALPVFAAAMPGSDTIRYAAPADAAIAFRAAPCCDALLRAAMLCRCCRCHDAAIRCVIY